MNTYLFVWNPKRWNWESLEEDIADVHELGNCPIRWSCGVNRSINIGDRAFLIRVGTEPKGIMGAGFVASAPFIDRHWNGEDKPAYFVDINIDTLLDPEGEPILTLGILATGQLAKQNWTPQASGISIRPELVDEVEALWFDFLTTQGVRSNPYLPQDEVYYMEGTASEVTQIRYERNPHARKACLEHYGYACRVCDFDFERVYGILGKGFIHVHHLTQVSKIGKKYAVDPIKDLRPVCPNCHAMLHRRMEGLTIEELRSLLKV